MTIYYRNDKKIVNTYANHLANLDDDMIGITSDNKSLVFAISGTLYETPSTSSGFLKIDGSNSPTADIDWGGYDLVNVGSVGIGTTSPDEIIHIKDTTPKIKIEDSDGGYAQLNGSNGNLVISADEGEEVADSSITFRIDGSTEAELNSTGLGIGTTSPASTLQVDGDAIIYDGTGTPIASPGVDLLVQHDTAGNPSISIIGNTTSVPILFFGDTDDERDAGIKYSNDNNSMSFFTNGSASYALLIDDNNHVEINNNLQIGSSIGGNDYILSCDSGIDGVLSVYSKRSGSNSEIIQYAYDLDGTDSVLTKYLAYESGADKEYLQIGWDTTDDKFRVQSTVDASGTIRDLRLECSDIARITLGNDSNLTFEADQADGYSDSTITFNVDGSTILDMTETALNIHDTDTYLKNTSAGSDGFQLVFEKQSASPADSDTIGDILFKAKPSDDSSTYEYASIKGYASDEDISNRKGGILFEVANYPDSTIDGRLSIEYNRVRIGDMSSEKYVLITDEGDLDVQGTYFKFPVKGTTGDPSTPADGWAYVNTQDNKVRVYADGSWRDLITW